MSAKSLVGVGRLDNLKPVYPIRRVLPVAKESPKESSAEIENLRRRTPSIHDETELNQAARSVWNWVLTERLGGNIICSFNVKRDTVDRILIVKAIEEVAPDLTLEMVSKKTGRHK